VEKNLTRSKELYDTVEDCDDPDLLCMLADSYGTGKSVVRNVVKKNQILTFVAMRFASGWPQSHIHLPDELKIQVEEVLLCTALWPEIFIPTELQLIIVQRIIAVLHVKKYT